MSFNSGSLHLLALAAALIPLASSSAEPIEIGARRELFVDDYLIETMRGDVRLQLHRPAHREIVLKTDSHGGKRQRFSIGVQGREPVPHVLSRPALPP